MRTIPRTTLHFERFSIYAFHPGTHPNFEYALCLSSTELNYRTEVMNITFLPLIIPSVPADNDPFRVPLPPYPKSSNQLPSRMYVMVDGIQSIGKRAFSGKQLGHLSDGERAEVSAKLKHWLGL